MTSLRTQLVVWLIGLLTTVCLLAGGISFLLARDDAEELLDHQLQMLAGSVYEGLHLRDLQKNSSEESEEEKESDYVIQVLPKGESIRSSRSDVILPIEKYTGYSDTEVNGKKWRSYTIVYSNRTVQVSQSDEVRSEIATDAALHAMLPIAVLIPLSWLLIFIGVGRLLKPIAAVTRALTENEASSLTMLPAHRVPDEVVPLVTEMNGLLLRIRETIEAQRNFMFDAAHQLRTPLAALQLQIDNVSQNRSGADLDMLVADLQAGVLRASRLINQMLKMARYEAARDTVKTRVELGEIVKTCISNFISIAEKQGIDLGMTHDDTAHIRANADDLGILFDNLLDNAIRYAPRGGRVDVSVVVSGEQAIVEIVDNGPGIPDHLLHRVFDRFFRVAGHATEGSGIGLAIVNAISRQENAQVSLSNRKDGQGLIAAVCIPIPTV